ncbi:MAG TPA: hypothetical protein VGR57_17525 [Ktedonobacterales bacterium]|nr:hypothetical protein [Ktedonobacterales bacterium]
MAEARCDTCGRALVADQAGGLICPSCGRAAAIPSGAITAAMQSSDDSTTRPVPEFARELAERPTAPPPPPVDPQTAPAMPYPGEYVPPALPRSGGVPALAARDATAAMPAGADSTGGRRAGRGAIASAITLLVLLLIGASGAVMLANGKLGSLLGVGTTSVATATPVPPTPTAASGFTTYVSPDGVYRLSVPKTWLVTQAPQTTFTATFFADPVTQANVNIEALPPGNDPNEATDRFMSQVGATLANPLGTSGGTSALNAPATADTTPLAGTLWTRKTATVSVTRAGQAAVSWQVVALATQHGQNTILIAYFAPLAVFAEENAAHFTPMLNSLTLG